MNHMTMTGVMKSKLEFSKFFGLDGGMPLSFSEKLQKIGANNVDNLFDEVFADSLNIKYDLYHRIIYDYVNMFKLQSSSKETIKRVKNLPQNNRFGMSKLGSMIPGGYAFVFSNTIKSSSAMFILNKKYSRKKSNL